MTFTLKSRKKTLELDHPVVMGILNVTPDSFSDGGEFNGVDKALERALEMIEEGAEIIDVGGESSGPGSLDVELEEELDRVIPVIKAIRATGRKAANIWISIDTTKAEVAWQALEAGADMVNDVMAMRADPEMARTVVEARVPIVLMYSKDSSTRTTAEKTHYDDVMGTIRSFLEERIQVAESAGIDPSQIIVDPGMGAFVSMDPKYSFEILHRLKEFEVLGRPILVGASRKSFLGGEGPKDRLQASLAAAMMAMIHGADIIRAHDVAPTVEIGQRIAEI